MGGASSSSLSDSQLKSRLQGMDDYDFEHLIADLWERQGWRATVKQQSVDRGVDVVAERDDPFPQKWLIQAKCYSGTIGGPDVRQYVSLQHRPGVDGAIVVSSGPFSKQARQEERDHNLKLIDGDALVSLIRNTDSYDLVDQYITVDAAVSSKTSQQTSFESSYSSESSSSSSSEYSESSESVSSDLSETSSPAQSDPSERDRPLNELEDDTRLDRYLTKVQVGSDTEGGVTGLTRILFEAPPKTNWWTAIVGTSAYWMLLFLIPESLTGGIMGGLMAIGLFISWPLMPIAIYKDSKIAPKYTANWEPHRWLYIIGTFVPLAGVIVGPIYLTRRWWYGNNREMNNRREVRREVRQILSGSESGSEDTIDGSTIQSSSGIEPHLYREYEKHLGFIRFINNNNPLVNTHVVVEYRDIVLEDLKSGELSDPRSPQIKRKLQKSLRESNAVLQEVKNTPPSSEFERTMKLYERYVKNVEIVNSELEMLVEEVDSGDAIQSGDEIPRSMNAIEEVTPKLSESMQNDLKEIKNAGLSIKNIDSN